MVFPIQFALFDADGVVIQPREQFFSERLVKQLGVSPADAIQFVHDAIVPSMTNKVDLQQVLPTYIKQWGIPMTVDELLAYWWSGENTVNERVVAEVDAMRARGIKTYLATDQEPHKARYLMEELHLNTHFDGGFFSYLVGATKNDDAFWQHVVGSLGPARSLIYWDDDPKNVALAGSKGIRAHYYQTYEEFKMQTANLT